MGGFIEGISFLGRVYRRHFIPWEALQTASVPWSERPKNKVDPVFN